MAIDWDTEIEQVEQAQREAREVAEQEHRQRREAYLADRERIDREQPEAVELAVRLLKSNPSGEAKIKAAAEVADLHQLRLWVRSPHLANLELR